MADDDCIVDRGSWVLCPVVLVTAELAWLPHRGGTCGRVAMDCGRALSAWFRRSDTVRVGLRTDRTRDSRTNCSAEEAGCCGLLPVRAKPDVRRLPHRLDRAVDRVRAGELVRDRGGGRCPARNRSVC